MEKNQQPPKLSFKPLSEGLGFHPFEEGLPYAPVNPKKLYPNAPPQNTAKFQLEKALLPKSESLPKTSGPMTETRAQKPTASAHQHTVLNGTYVLRRVGAYIFDTLTIGLLAGGVLFFTFPHQDLESFSALDTQDLFLALIFYMSCHWGLITAQEMAFGTSLGKLVFNLRLPGSGFDVLLRSILFLPSLGLGALGIVIGAFDQKKRCWHDRATNIQPLDLSDPASLDGTA